MRTMNVLWQDVLPWSLPTRRAEAGHADPVESSDGQRTKYAGSQNIKTCFELHERMIGRTCVRRYITSGCRHESSSVTTMQ